MEQRGQRTSYHQVLPKQILANNSKDKIPYNFAYSEIP